MFFGHTGCSKDYLKTEYCKTLKDLTSLHIQKNNARGWETLNYVKHCVHNDFCVSTEWITFYCTTIILH